MSTERPNWKVILSRPCVYNSELKRKVWYEDAYPVKDVPVGREAIAIPWAGLQPWHGPSGALSKWFGSPHARAAGVTGGLVLEGTGDKSLFPACLLEAHHGFQVIVLDT